MKRNKKTKPVQSAPKKLFDSDAYTDILDTALTSAEEQLKALLPTFKPSEVSEAFATHIHTHLSTELSNIEAHGHRNDDPEDVPPTPAHHTPSAAHSTVKTKFVKEITVQDPDTGNDIEIEVHKDPESGAMFAIDSSFLDQISETIPSPFNADTDLKLDEPGTLVSARSITKAPKMAEFVNLIARMKTESEFGDNAPPSEDGISTLNDLIAKAREIVKL